MFDFLKSARAASGASHSPSPLEQELVRKFAALDRSQAIIEFTPDGTIVTANDNFLAAVGYTLAEVKGNHHSMFVEPEYRNSSEYRQFWAKLGRGEFDANQYLRIAKGGREVWIQASYNPILGPDGKVVGVVKFATDITAAKTREFDWSGQLAAIGKSQAVIEFTPDGTILTANENFLGAVGYSLSDIRGKHHSMFVDPNFRETAEYRQFWAKLGRGEFDAGQYPRYGRGGKLVWLQASYNPILDGKGRVMKVVKYCSDITAQKLAAEELAKVTAETSEVIGSIARGDLSKQMVGQYSASFDGLKSAVNTCVDNLQNMVSQITDASSSIATSSGEIAQGNQDLSQRTEQQASSLEETASSMEELTSTVKQNADNARQANQLARTAREQAETGGQVVGTAISAMAEINRASNKIADIIGVIDEIAFQTNLLALNAAVEAARAGDQGRGFAVVASEVRNLAQRSAGAAKEIKSLIKDSVDKVEEGSRLVNNSGATLEEIVSAVKKVSDIISEIAAASEEQSAGIEQVNKAITHMDQAVQQNAALVEQAAAASESMDEQSRSLSRLMEFFSGGAPVDARSANRPAGGVERRSATRPWSSGPAGKPQAAAKPKTKAKAAVGGGSNQEWEDF